MDLLQTINTLLLVSAGCAGLYAVGRLFYVAATAPTTVYRRASGFVATVIPAVALASEAKKNYTILVAHSDGSVQATVKSAQVTVKQDIKKPEEQL